MFKIFKIILLTFAGIISLIILSLIIAYFSLSGNYNPVKTVEHNDKLPQIIINNTKFHCETYGNDTSQVIIVLNGGPGNDYKNLLHLKQLSDKFKVVFYDQRGCGLSQRVPIEQLTLKNYIKDLNQIIEKYSPKRKVILIGQSWGANLAIFYTAKYPDKIETLILSSPSALNNKFLKIFREKIDNNKAPSFSIILHLISSWLKSLHVDGPDEFARNDFFIREFTFNCDDKINPLKKFYGKSIPQSEKNLWRFGADASLYVAKSIMNSDNNFRKDFSANFNKFNGKTFVFTGENDKITGKDFQLLQKKEFDFYEIIEIKNCGHNVLSEKPKLALQKIKEILYAKQN